MQAQGQVELADAVIWALQFPSPVAVLLPLVTLKRKQISFLSLMPKLGNQWPAGWIQPSALKGFVGGGLCPHHPQLCGGGLWQWGALLMPCQDGSGFACATLVRF